MEATDTTTVPALLFDNSSIDTAARSAVQAVVALQQALANAPGLSPLSDIHLVQLASTSTRSIMFPAVSNPVPPGMLSPEVSLRFTRSGFACLELTVPAIGPSGASGPPSVSVDDHLLTHARAIDILRNLWQGVFGQLATLADS